MACKLTRQPDGSFQAKTGEKVQVDVRSDDGAAKTVRITYAGEQDGAAPFEFETKADKNKLLIVAVGVKDDQKMEVVEVDGANECHLKNFFWSSTHFHTTLDIVGV